MNKSILSFLGTDSGFGTKNNSAYIESDDTFTLIDCGYTVFNILKEKFNFNKYNKINIIVTHLHNDHAGSLSQFILYLWFVCHKKADVFCKCKNIETYLNITGVPKESYSLNNESINLEFIETTHSPDIDAYGFMINYEGNNILYTGDTATLKPFIPYLPNSNEFYVDVSKFGSVHLKIDDVLNNLIQINSSNTKVYLMHLDDKNYIKNLVADRLNFAQ